MYAVVHNASQFGLCAAEDLRDACFKPPLGTQMAAGFSTERKTLIKFIICVKCK